MEPRWMPLVAAAVGLLGGIGGAYIGGVVANEGQERRSESERAAAIQDLRVSVYGDFLGYAEGVTAAFATPGSLAERQHAAAVAYRNLLPAEARVLLVAEDPAALEKQAEAVKRAIANDDQAAYGKATRSFLFLARDEIASTGP